MNKHYKVVNVAQGSQEWLDWRTKGISATDAVVLMGSPYKTPWRLWAEKVGYAEPTDLSGNPNVRRGNRLEPIARQAWEEKHGEILFPACVASSRNALMRASLDGLADDGRPVELKAPSRKTWDDVVANGESSEAFQLYWIQVQHQMLVLGAKSGYLVFYDEVDGLLEFFVKRDDDFCREIIRASAVFWKQVLRKSAPDKDPERDEFIPEGEDAERWKAAALQYRQCQAEIDSLKARVKQLQEEQSPHVEEMKAVMTGHRKTDFYGVMLTEFEASGAVDYRKLVGDMLDLNDDEIERYRNPSALRHRVTVTDRLMPKDIVDKAVRSEVEKAPVIEESVEDVFF